MLALTIPTASAIWNLTEPPPNEVAWQDIRVDAAMLAESARLLLVPGRADNDAAWSEYARELAISAELVIDAIDARNFDKLLQASEAIYRPCEECHAQFTPDIGIGDSRSPTVLLRL